MKLFFQIVLVLFILWICAVLASVFAGVSGALVAIFLHAGPTVITMVVRILSTVFFFLFVFLAWLVYSRIRERKLARKTSTSEPKS